MYPCHNQCLADVFQSLIGVGVSFNHSSASFEAELMEFQSLIGILSKLQLFDFYMQVQKYWFQSLIGILVSFNLLL